MELEQLIRNALLTVAQVKGAERTFAMFSLQTTTSGGPSPSRSGERGRGSRCRSGPLPQRISASERGRESHPANAKKC